MSQAGYLTLAIAIIVILIAIFIFVYLANRKIPAPEGYKGHHPSQEKCGGCAELGCPFYERFHKEEQ